MTEVEQQGNDVQYGSYNAIPGIRVVNVPEEELQRTADRTGIVSIDDWLRLNDAKRRETVVPGNGGFRYPRMNLSDEDRLALSGSVEAVRRGFLNADREQLREIRAGIDKDLLADE